MPRHGREAGHNISVTVVTGTVGSPLLTRALASVEAQTYAQHAHVEHWVVVDGPQHEQRARSMLDGSAATVLVLPHNTGGTGYNAHRIYAAMPWLVRTTHVCFLDEDNAFEPDHLEHLVEALREASWGAVWAHSLRSITGADGAIVCMDACESLGALRHTAIHPTDFLVDVNCYLLDTRLAKHASSCWDAKARPGEGELEVDRRLCLSLLNAGLLPAVSKRHSVRYMAGNRSDSVSAAFFIKGNEQTRYVSSLPDIYLFHISPDATRAALSKTTEMQRSPLDHGAPTMWDALAHRVNLIDGYVHSRIIRPGSTILIVAPDHVPAEIMERTDVRRILVPMGTPRPREMPASDAVLGDDGGIWCPNNMHVLDLNDALHRTIGLRRNLAGSGAACIEWTQDTTVDDMQRVSFVMLPDGPISTPFFDAFMAGAIPVLASAVAVPPELDIPSSTYVTSHSDMALVDIPATKDAIQSVRERVLRRAGVDAFARAVLSAISHTM